MTTWQTIRMLIAEWLLGKAIDVSPRTPEGIRLAQYVGAYMQEQTDNRTKPVQKEEL